MSLALLLVLTSLAAYRAVRLATVDDFPPVVWFRDHLTDWLEHRFGVEWAAGVACPWCAGFWICEGVVAAVWAWASLPLPVLWFAAVPAAVGALAELLGAMDS